MKRRTRAQEARLAELLVAGWEVAEEYPLLGMVTLIRGIITDNGAVGAEYKTIGRNGQDLRGNHAKNH